MRRMWPGLLAVLACGLLPACGAPPPERVVLVTIDTLRADHVGSYGAAQAETRTLDALAAEGVRFETAVSAAPYTLPSHTTLLTGLNPPQHGVRDNLSFVLSDAIPTLAERFRDGGWATAAFVASVVLDGASGISRGFDVYGDRIHEPGVDRPEPLAERPADRVIDETLAWLDGAPDRFFLWVHLYDPHTEYTPPPEYAARFENPYDAEIAFADAQLGRLFEALRNRWPEGTLRVVLSDHGESLGEHGMLAHGYSLYESTQRVPLLFAGPGIPAGEVVTAPARVVDVAPTLLALADLPALPGIAGEDLRPLWQGGAGKPRSTYMETLGTQLSFGWSPLLGVRTERYKYIRAPRRELYDLESDPHELHNLAAARSELADDLDAKLESFLADARPVEMAGGVSAADRARLEALGYMEPVPLPEGAVLGQVGGDDPKDKTEAIQAVFAASGLIRDHRAGEALRLLNRFPEDGTLFTFYRVKAYAEAGRHADAEREARRLIGMGAKLETAWFLLARALWRQGRVDEAIEAMQQAIAETPDRAPPLLGLGMFYEQQGDLDAAEVQYRRATEVHDGVANARVVYAAFLLEQGRVAESDAVLAELSDEAWIRPEAVVRLAEAEVKAGRREQAARRLAAARKRDPNSPKLAFAWFNLSRRSGNANVALSQAERDFSENPGSAAAMNNLAWLLAETGQDLDRALVLAQRAASMTHDHPEVIDTLATVRLQRGEALQAVRAAARGLPKAEGPSRARLLYVRAAAFSALGETERARAALAGSLALLAEEEPPPWAGDAVDLSVALGVELPPALQNSRS